MRLSRHTVARPLAFVLLAAICLAAGRLSLRWNELGAWARPDTQIRVTLNDGTRIEGSMIRATSEALVVTFRKSDNPRLHAVGEETIARTAIRGIELRRDKKDASRKGFAIGATIGALLGALGGAISDKSPGDSQALGALLGAAAGIAVYGGIGYAIGRSSDLAWTPVEILPDP